jgi:hypothetical protein
MSRKNARQRQNLSKRNQEASRSSLALSGSAGVKGNSTPLAASGETALTHKCSRLPEDKEEDKRLSGLRKLSKSRSRSKVNLLKQDEEKPPQPAVPSA